MAAAEKAIAEDMDFVLGIGGGSGEDAGDEIRVAGFISKGNGSELSGRQVDAKSGFPGLQCQFRAICPELWGATKIICNILLFSTNERGFFLQKSVMVQLLPCIEKCRKM